MQASLPIAAIQNASRDVEFIRAMDALYAQLDADIAARQPVCTNRGACCRFEAFEHNLFVTATELAYFLAKTDDPLLAPPDRSHCAYQQAGQCTARSARPAGCRIFFCEPASQHWQSGYTERAIRQLATLGEQFGIPYAYVEWTDALRALGGKIVAHGATSPTIPLRIDSDESSS